MNDDRPSSASATGAEGKQGQGEVREIDISELMPNARETVIIYRGERYRLRITSREKLILTK